MARWIVVLMGVGIVAAALGGCAPSPPRPAALSAGATAPAATTAPTITATLPPTPIPLTPMPPSSPSPPPPSPSPALAPIFPTQPVQQIPMPAPRTPMPTAVGAAPRVIILPTPWQLMDDAAFGERARADLAQRLKLAPDAVEVVSVTRGEAPIGVFNCAAQRTPGKVPYTQPAFVTAVEIVLRVAGREVTYYAQGQRLVTCDVP